MSTLWDNITSKMLRSGSKLYLLIGINVAIFLAINIPSVIEWLFTGSQQVISFYSNEYLALPAYLPKLLIRFWTPITYMFMHDGIFHILFNMLWLYWLGQIFEEYLGNKRIVGVYLLGGLAGAAFFVLSYNLFPVFSQGNMLMLSSAVGASASVMAIIVATATLLPDYTIPIFIIGPVKLKWLAIAFIVIDFLSIAGPNSGGEIAHLGGALLGFVYIKRLQSGSDWVANIAGIFKRGPRLSKLKVVARNKVTRASSRPREDEVDAILEKISKVGYENLNREEKKYCFAPAKMKVNRRLNLFDKLIMLLNIVVCAAILISYFASSVSPAKNGLIALFGLAYPPLLLLNLIMILIWLLRRRWFFILSLACILIGWNTLANNIGFHSASADFARPDTADIRMMTYNVHEFKKYGEKRDNDTKHEFLEVVHQQQPDIIGFQEFFSHRKGRFDMFDSLKTVINGNYYYFEPFTHDARKMLGMAIFSKYPIISQGIVQLSGMYNENQCLYVDVKKDTRVFRVYSVHLQSIRFDPEDYNFIDSGSTKGKTNLSSTRHVKDKLITAFLKRSQQVSKIKNDAARCPYPYIISGDFNDTPASYAVNQMAKGLKNAFREKGSGLGKTYNGDFPNYQIDYIMASPQFDVASYKIIEKKLSDHYPVRSDLVLH